MTTRTRSRDVHSKSTRLDSKTKDSDPNPNNKVLNEMKTMCQVIEEKYPTTSKAPSRMLWQHQEP